MEPRATIDFETRSACNIQKAGAWIYSKHPSTLLLCLAWVLPGQDPNDPSLWHAGFGDTPAEVTGPTTLEDLFDHIRSGGLVEAHNSFFEFVIWSNIATRPYETVVDELDGGAIIGARGLGAPPLKLEQMRCSAAKAAAMAFPRALAEAGQAVGLPVEKDMAGNRIMLTISKPRRKRKGDVEGHVYYLHDEDKHRRTHSYCKGDVTTEHHLSEKVPDLSPFELRVWQADQRANLRGVKIDKDLVEAAIKLDEKVKRKLNRELFLLTGVASGTMRAQVLAWLKGKGVDLPDSQAPTLDWVLANGDIKDRNVRRVIQIVRDINRTSVAKFQRIKEMMDPDDHRVRDLVRYCGAATGRWAGSGIQVQNFPSGDLGSLTGVDGYSIDAAVEDVKEGDLDWLEVIYGDVLSLLSSVSRGALIPSQGRKLVVADYAAIEARVVLWLAGAELALDVFRRGEDIYCDMASGIYGRTITKKDKTERKLGKVAILGLGYGMGYLTFFLTLRSYEMSFTEAEVRDILGPRYDKAVDWVMGRLQPRPEAFRDEEGKVKAKQYKAALQQAKADLARIKAARETPSKIVHELALARYLVDVYRKRYPEVTELWKNYERESLNAVISGDAIEVGRVTWVVEDRFLKCILPTERALIYADPFVKEAVTPWGKTRPELRYFGVHKKTKKWSRMSTYGGKLTENVTQATAREMMAHAFVHADEHPDFDPLATVHDELVAEADEDVADVRAFEQIMLQIPPCFDGCPVAAEGATMPRYRK